MLALSNLHRELLPPAENNAENIDLYEAVN